MAVGLCGCSSKNTFKKNQQKVIKALEKTCDAEEMSEKTKKKLLKNGISDSKDLFEDGVYVSLTGEEAEKTGLNVYDMNLEAEDVKNMFIYAKPSGHDSFAVWVIETQDKELAQDCFDAYCERMNLKSLKKQMKKTSKAGDIMFGIEEDDNNVAFITFDRSNGILTATNFFVEDNVFVQIECTGTDEDLYDEFFDFMREAEFTDMEELL